MIMDFLRTGIKGVRIDNLSLTGYKSSIKNIPYGVLLTGDINGVKEVARVNVADFQKGSFQIRNDGADALTNFEVWVRVFNDKNNISDLVRIAYQATDYSSPQFPMLRASALVTLASGDNGFLFLDVATINEVVLKAKATTELDLSISGHFS